MRLLHLAAGLVIGLAVTTANAQSQPAAPAPSGQDAGQVQPAPPPGEMMMRHHGSMQGQTGGHANSPMRQSMRGMHQAMMNAPVTGDPDHDFAALMIPHHQGAVDMARAELEQGKDPELRKLAAAVIKAQEKEIRQLKAWLKSHPAP